MFAVIMAGGSGTRFWPASRTNLPKQFLKITSDRTMLEETLARVNQFTTLDRTYAVVGKIHEDVTSGLLTGTPVKILIEPVGRNTAACIGLAALHIKRLSADEPMIILPADHFIADVKGFAETILASAEVAKTGAIVTLGIAPNRPETGYGYIQTGETRGESNGRSYFAVERFVEKPDFETAVGYLANGSYLWNSGIFIFTPRTILDELQACMPELYQGLLEIDKAIGSDNYASVLDSAYVKLPSVSIDYGVMEKTKRPIFVFKSEFGWSDVGSWQALHELRTSEYDANGNLLLADSMVVDSRNNLVFSNNDRRVALLGVEGLVVVDTSDVVMIADLKRSQDVKRFTEMERKNE